MADFQAADKANSDKKAVQRKAPASYVEQSGIEAGGLNANQLAILHMQQSQGNRAVLRMMKASQANRVSRDPKNTGDDPYAEFDTAKPAAATPADPAAEAAKAAEFDRRGQDALNNLGGADAAAASESGGGGHSEGKDIPGWPDWFNQLQHKLNFGTKWGENEEAAQGILHDYAVWRSTKDNGGKLPASVEIFFRYLGRSAANRQANAAFKQDGQATPNAGQLGAGQGYAWCANATSTAFKQALTEKGLRITGGFNQDWFNAHKLQINHPKASTEPLRPGDEVSYVAAPTPPSGHVVTVVEASGDEFLAVSGNSTSVKGGGTGLDKTKREMPPSGWTWPTDQRKPAAGLVWIATIIRLSEVDPAQIDPNDNATLKKYGLERIPVST